MNTSLSETIAKTLISDSGDFQRLLQSILAEAFDLEYVFYFEREDLLPEAKFVFGNQAAFELNSSQYFYQLKDMAFQMFGRPAQIVNEIDPTIPKNSFRSALFYPVDFTQDARGILVLANPKKRPQFLIEDLDFLKDIFKGLGVAIENIKLKRRLELVEAEVSLINKITYIVDMSPQAGFFFKCLGQLLAETIDCQIVIFLMLDPQSGVYKLEAGNDAGNEFWVGQTEFFRSLAKDSETRGVFSESYGGKFFKGEKYGLEKLETSLVLPIQFYQRSRGVFILLNKNGLKNFCSADIRLVTLLSGFSKAVIYREIEKKRLGGLFKRFVSAKIGDKILKNEDYSLELEGRHRITAMFVDINGFTAFTEQADSAVVTRQLNTYFQEMTDLIVAYDGTLDKYLGDGIMAIFGSPIRISNHAERAVECALAMQAKMSEITQHWIEQGLHAMTASIGVCTGEALVGAIGCDQFLDYTAIGDCVNVSSRLCGAARHGTILISESSYESMQDVLICEPMHGLKLKGKSQNVVAYEVQALKNIYEIREQLREADIQKKTRVIEALGNFGVYRDSDTVLDYLDDRDPSVRSSVVHSIGKLNKEYHMNVVINHLEREQVLEIRAAILNLILNIQSDPLNPLMEKAIRGVAPGVRPTILRATIQSPQRDDKRLFLALIKSLQDLEESQSSMMADLTRLLYQTEDVPIMRMLIDSLPDARQAVKISILRTLTKIDIPQIAAPMVSALEVETEPEVQYAIAKALGKITNEKTLKLLGILFHENPSLNHWHAYILCRQSKNPLPLYKELLHQEDPVLKFATLVLFGRGASPDLEEDLLKMLCEAPQVMIQTKIIECLGKCSSARVMPVYLSLLGKHPNLDMAILSEIGFRKQVEHLDILHSYFSHKNVQLKVQAIMASGQIASPLSLPLLIKALDEQDNANDIASIVRVLGNFKTDQVLLRVVQALSSPIGRIRANAIDSLMAMNAQQALHQIERLLQDDNNRARANAALACLRFGEIQHFSVLAEMASSTNKWMRLSCLWALSVTGMPQAREIILGLIQDPDYDVLLSAIGFLKKIEQSGPIKG